MKYYFCLLFSLSMLISSSCKEKGSKKISKTELCKIIDNEEQRYAIYFDTCISNLQKKTAADSSKLTIGSLFKNQVKSDETFQNILSYKRWDAYIKQKGKDGKMQLQDFHVSYKSLQYETTVAEYSPNFSVTVSPFVWHDLQIDITSSANFNRLPVEKWAYKWLSPNDSTNSTVKLATIHSINFISATDTAQINIDMGCTKSIAFYELLDSIKSSGAQSIHIKSYSNEH